MNRSDPSLRITTRLANLYKHDVEVECQPFNGSDSSFSATFSGESTVAIDSTNQVICHLKGGYAVELLLEITKFLGVKRIELLSNTSEYKFGAGSDTESPDLFVASYALTESRRRYVDPTYVTGHSNLKAFLNHAFEASQRDTLFAPFQLSLWALIILTALISLSGIHLLSSLRKWSIGIPGRGDFNIDFHILLDGLSVILLKGNRELVSHSDSMKIAIVVISLSFFVYFETYSGLIVAISSFPKYKVKSFASLTNSQYDIFLDKGYGNGSSIEAILQKLRKKDAQVNQFLEKASKSKHHFDSFENAMKKVQKGPVAFITEDDTGRAAIGSTIGEIPCTWEQIDVKRIRYPWAMFMRKGMPYRHEINSLFLKMDERGVMTQIRRRWMPKIPVGTCEKGDVNVSMLDVASGLNFIIVAIVLATILLVLEICNPLGI